MTEADKLAYKKRALLLRLANLEDDQNEKYKLHCKAFSYLSDKEKAIYKRLGWEPRKANKIEYR